MNIEIKYIQIAGLALGMFIAIIYIFCRKKEPQWARIIWLDIIRNVVVVAIITACTHIFSFMGIYFFGSCITVIESETAHTSYMHFGSSDDYLIDLEPREVYVHNKMNRTILVHSLPSDNGLTKDWVILRPGQIAKVHSGPQYYFEKTPDHYRGKSLLNAVDYYDY